MTDQIRELGAKLRNLFAAGEFQKRFGDGRIQVKTHNNRAVEKKEAFPYGFCAKAKSGRAFVFCQGGNLDGFEIFPVQPGDGITPPGLEDGDAALYTGNGGWIIVREKGSVELFGTDAGGAVKAHELKIQLAKITARIDGVINALINSQTAVMDGGATYKAQIAAILATLADKENFSNIESEKVLHGTG